MAQHQSRKLDPPQTGQPTRAAPMPMQSARRGLAQLGAPGASQAAEQVQHLARQHPATLQLAAQGRLANARPQARHLAAMQALANPLPPQPLPERLMDGIAALSGLRLDQARVHRHSDLPAQLNAHAFAQGHDIHLAPGQEQHLPHEAWHLVQQAQGRVAPTGLSDDGRALNTAPALEREATEMGRRALTANTDRAAPTQAAPPAQTAKTAQTADPAQTAKTAPSAVLQAQLTGDEEEDQRIKIWQDGKVVEVYLAKAWAGGNVLVQFFRSKLSSKHKKATKPEKIAPNLAFPLNESNEVIKAEILQEEEAQHGMGESALGDLVLNQDVIAYFIDLVNRYKEDYNLSVAPTKPKIQLMIQAIPDLASQFVKGDVASLEEIKEMIDEDNAADYVEQIMEEMAHTGVQKASSGGQGGGGGSSSDEWKTTRTEKLKGQTLKRVEDAELAHILAPISTLHHKMSRSRFKTLLVLLRMAPSDTEGVKEVWEFIATVRSLTRSGEPDEALENWAANIELGVLVEKRKKGDDPSDGFDGNYPGGTATPRTRHLEEVDLMITSIGPIHWLEIAQLLSQAQAEHVLQTRKLALEPDEFTDPHLGQWTHTSEGFVRDKKRPNSNSSSSSRILSIGEGPSERKSEEKSESKRELILPASTISSTSISSTTSSSPPLAKPKLVAEPDLSKTIVESVLTYMAQYRFDPGRPVMVVSGSNWACYIRCVLHHFNLIGKYSAVMANLQKGGVDIGSGVTVGSAQELKVIAAITQVTGQVFRVKAIDAQHGGISVSNAESGAWVPLLRTGVHFSLLL